MIRTNGTASLEQGAANLGDTPATVLTTHNPAAVSVFTSGTITIVANNTCAAPAATPFHDKFGRRVLLTEPRP